MAHSGRGRLNHRDVVGIPQVRDGVEEKARGRPPRNDGQGDALRGDGMADDVEGAHVRAGDDDPLSSLARLAEDGEAFHGDGNERSPLAKAEVADAEQFAKVARRHAEHLTCDRLQPRPRRVRSHHLADVGHDVSAVNRRQMDPDVADAIGDAVPQPIRQPGRDARNDVGSADRQLVTEFARLFFPVAVAGAARNAGSGCRRRCAGGALLRLVNRGRRPGRDRHIRHPPRRRAAASRGWHRKGPAARG